MLLSKGVRQFQQVLGRWLIEDVTREIMHLLDIVAIGFFFLLIANLAPVFFRIPQLIIIENILTWTAILVLSIASLVSILRAMRKLITMIVNLMYDIQRTIQQRRHCINSKNHKTNKKCPTSVFVSQLAIWRQS